MKKIGVLILAICMLGMLIPSNVYAASSKVTVSGGSGNVGSRVQMTCTASTTGATIGSAEISLSYDATALKPVAQSDGANAVGGGVYCSGYASSDGKYSISFSVTFEILKVGQHKITIQSAEVTDFEDRVLQLSKTNGTITGKTPTSNNNGGTGNQGSGSNSGSGNNTQPSKDSNNKLSSLQIYPGTLSPSFSAGVTSYNVTVPKTTTAVTISATPQSSKANVTVSGGKDLKLGPNTAQVVVVAENGSSMAYTINIKRGEDEKISVNNIEHTIDETFTDAQIPTGFSRTTITYKEREYKGLVNEKGNMHLMSLKNSNGTSFFIYNQETNEFHNFVQITIAEGKYIVPMPLEGEVSGLKDAKKTTIKLQEKDFEIWQLDEEFSIVYVMNQDGEQTWYRYDSVDGTFQRYTDAELTIEPVGTIGEKKALFPNQYYMYAIVGLGSLCFILLIAMIYFIASRKQRREGRKKKAQRKLEKQRLKEQKIAKRQRQEDEKEIARKQAMEETDIRVKKRSTVLILGTVLATLYGGYLLFHFVGGTVHADGISEAIGGAIATAMITPHMIMFLLGAIFGWLGVFLRKPWAALVAAILYSVGTVFFLLYAMFGVPILIFGFVGYAKQNKVNKQFSDNE